MTIAVDNDFRIVLDKHLCTITLADIDEQAENMFSQLVKDLAEKENITEKLQG